MIALNISRLPDYLLDHTLLSEAQDERLTEHFSRWSEFVGRLGAWRGRAIFCLRFETKPKEERVDIWLLARSRNLQEEAILRSDLKYALRVYGVVLADELFDSSKEITELSTDYAIWGMAQTVEGEAWVNQEAIRTLADRSDLGKLMQDDTQKRAWLPIQMA